MEKKISARITKSERVWFDISIEPNEDLRFEVYDYSPALETCFGASDHEHTVTVGQMDKDKLLVALLRDRFLGAEKIESESGYADWLREQEIEPKVFCWIGG